MSFIKIERRKYKDGLTKQSFKDQCDINKILKKAQQTGSIAHLAKYDKAVYGEFNQNFDLLTARRQIERANEIFADLPSEVRSEFGNDALKFVQFAGDPANNDKLAELIPAIARPGDYFPNPVARGGGGAGMATPPKAAPAAAQDVSGGDPPAPLDIDP